MINTENLLSLGKKEISKITFILGNIDTGHLSLQSHLYKVGCSDNSICRACGEDDETLEHFSYQT